MFLSARLISSSKNKLSNKPPGESIPLTAEWGGVALRALRRWGWLLYLVGITFLLGWLFGDWAYDDPFITYRYAANLARGLGLVYNPGERVLSTTTLLWSLLLAPLSAFHLDLQSAAVWVGAACLGLGGLCLWKLGALAGQRWMGWAGLLLYPIHPLVVTSLGSETPLYLALVLGTLALAAQGRLRGAACLAGLAVLSRPDGMLVPIVLLLVSGVLFVWRRSTGRHDRLQAVGSRSAWQPLFIFFIVVTPLWWWAWVYYGSPLPVTLAAKQQQGLMTISDLFMTGFWKLLAQYWAVDHWRILFLLAALGMVYLAVWVLRSIYSSLPVERSWGSLLPVLLLLAWTAAYFNAYVLLGVSRYFWYYAPLAPWFSASVGLGLESISRLWQGLVNRFHKKGSTTWMKQTTAVGQVCLAVVLLGFGALQLRDISKIPNDARMPVYRQVGEWLATNTPVESRVGMLEVGVIGYYSQRSVVDFAGLIQPQTAMQLTSGTTYEDAALWAISVYQPEYLVLHNGLFPRVETQILTDLRCHEVQRFTGLQSDIVVYSCRR